MKAVEHLQTLSVDYVAGDAIPCEGNWRLKEVAEVMALFKANPVSFTYKESALPEGCSESTGSHCFLLPYSTDGEATKWV